MNKSMRIAAALVAGLSVLAAYTPGASATADTAVQDPLPPAICHIVHSTSPGTQYQARVCAGLQWTPSAHTVGSHGRILGAHINTHVRIEEIWLKRATPDYAVIARCQTESNCPVTSHRAEVQASTRMHGPCRDSQTYYTVVRATIRFPNGDMITNRDFASSRAVWRDACI